MGEHSRDYASPGAGGPGRPEAPGGGQQDPAGPGFQYDGEVAERDRGLSREQVEAGMRQTYPEGGEQTPSRGDGGGHYEVSLGQLRYAIGQVDNLLNAAMEDQNDARDIANAMPPAKDAEGSVMFTNSLKQRGQQISDLIQEKIDDIKDYKDYLAGIASNYANQEDATTVQFKDFQRKL